MSRFASFDEAVSVLEEQDRVSVASLARALGASHAAAAMLLDRLRAEGHVAAEEEDGWSPVIGAQSRRRWSRGPQPSQSLPGRMAALEAEVATLRHKLREAEERAERLAASLAGQRGAGPAGGARGAMHNARRRLRHQLARALHPDVAVGSLAERALYDELFKRLWPQVEAIIEQSDAEDAGA